MLSPRKQNNSVIQKSSYLALYADLWNKNLTNSFKLKLLIMLKKLKLTLTN